MASTEQVRAMLARWGTELAALESTTDPVPVNPPAPGRGKRFVLVPAYFPPWDDAGLAKYRALAASIKAHPEMRIIVIVDINDGNFSAVPPAYLEVFKILDAVGAEYILYIDSKQGTIPGPVVCANIAKATAVVKAAGFHPRGHFIDDVKATYMAHYADIAAASRAAVPGGTLVGNPGANGAAPYWALFDITVMAEDYNVNPALTPQALAAADTKFAILSHGTTAAAMRASIASLPAEGVGGGYWTGSEGGHAWGDLGIGGSIEEQIKLLAAAPAAA